MKQMIKQIAEYGPKTLGEKSMVPLLALASLGYGLGDSLRRFTNENLISKKELACPVISVGNITWGGTGKTPFVKYLVEKLQGMKKDVMVLTRGYSYDEVRELKSRFPDILLGVGKNRFQTAQKLMNGRKPDVCILDDGFQHTSLKRNLEIVLINGDCPFGSGRLIPWGSLREPLSELRKADLIVTTHANTLKDSSQKQIDDVLSKFAPKAKRLKAVHEFDSLIKVSASNKMEDSYLRGKKVICVSGIGYPQSFYRTVQSLGAQIAYPFNFEDHHEFTRSELEQIKQVKQTTGCEEILITEKDFSRQPEIVKEILDPVVVCIKMKIEEGEDQLDARLHCL